MKFSSAFILAVASVATTVSAAPHETNGERLARGLPPMAPVRRSGTPAYAAKRTSPSGTPSQCNTGSTLCCDRTSTAGLESILLGLLGILGLDPNTSVGVTCSPLSVIGVGGNSWNVVLTQRSPFNVFSTQQPVCCENNNFNGVIAIGCSPINL
ncbi:hypothetical protein D9758_005349 [Tetrapyrgos nigripes]|uniref:Hydrophobin n=1 Tax=Tetrapyrgos nigripes TaxID=182062 RepID=A0A8H5GI74_9AGAR|nr:hypothetical protein D9758_005349 [Tetrapyrgos nigripes]